MAQQRNNEIDPGSVHEDRVGMMTRRWFVRLPVGLIADDTKNPAIWRAVQQNRHKMLRRHDQVCLVGYEEDFAVEGYVVEATAEAAVLDLRRIIKFPERTVPLFNDGTYRVAWAGTGYAVIRIADGRQMGNLHGSEALAIRAIRQLYPQPAA